MENLSSLSVLVGVKRCQNPSFVEQDNRFWLSHNENTQNNIIIYKSLWSEKKGAIENDIMVSKWDPNVWKTQKSKDEYKNQKPSHLQNIPSALKQKPEKNALHKHEKR